MAKVFITNDAGLNFTAAEKYGELVRCTAGKLNVYNPDKIAWDMERSLSTYRDGDFLILAGGSMGMFFAGMFIPDQVSKIQLLVFDAKLSEYFVRTITNPHGGVS